MAIMIDYTVEVQTTVTIRSTSGSTVATYTTYEMETATSYNDKTLPLAVANATSSCAAKAVGLAHAAQQYESARNK